MTEHSHTTGQVERIVELEGRAVLCHKREVGPHTGARATEYSFDGGATWHPTMADAYAAAKEAGALIGAGEQPGQDGSFEAWLLAFVAEIQALKPGESMRLTMTERELIVTREQTVLATRRSTITEVDLNMSGGNE